MCNEEIKKQNNIQVYRDVVIRNCMFGDGCLLADDVFVSNSKFGKSCTVERRGMIFNSTIGDYTYTGYNTVVKYANIGKYCSISWNVSIGGANHDFSKMTTHPFPFKKKYGFCEKDDNFQSFEQDLEIGNDVWIGANASLMRGIIVGNGAVIGAGAVVTHSVPAYEIWAGVPAKKIGQRFSDEIIEKLEHLKWWDLSEKEIKENIDMFKTDLTESGLDEMLIKYGRKYAY